MSARKYAGFELLVVGATLCEHLSFPDQSRFLGTRLPSPGGRFRVWSGTGLGLCQVLGRGGRIHQQNPGEIQVSFAAGLPDCSESLSVHFQVSIEILSIIFDDEDLNEAKAGDNVKLKLRGIEEDVRDQ